jgi:CRISPR-associated protein Csy3
MSNLNIFNPPMMAFTRSLETSEALMFGVNSSDIEQRIPVEVTETGQRGQSSHEALNRDKKGASKAGKSNPQVVEIARLPVNSDTLIIEVGLRVMPNATQPSATDTHEARASYQDLAKTYGEMGGFKILAERYLENIANGRFAWRNRTLSNKATVKVNFDGKVITFNPFSLDPDEIMGRDAMKAAVVQGSTSDVDALVDHIENGLRNEPVDLTFEWAGKVLQNIEVYPSQEYKFSDAAKDKSVPSRLLSSVRSRIGGERINQATMHSQKIGAALRSIDDWHGSVSYGAIPVNPFGGVQEAGIALRHSQKGAPSFYDLIKKPELFMEDLENGTLNDNAHFLMANLIRGGVYGSGKEA